MRLNIEHLIHHPDMFFLYNTSSYEVYVWFCKSAFKHHIFLLHVLFVAYVIIFRLSSYISSTDFFKNLSSCVVYIGHYTFADSVYASGLPRLELAAEEGRREAKTS
jgi:hypothetical protein